MSVPARDLFRTARRIVLRCCVVNGTAFAAVVALLLTVPAAAEEPSGGFPTFREVVVDPHCGDVCYAVTLADVDGDGKQDIVAVTENAVLWYQAPKWTKHTIIEDQTPRDNVCIAAHDIDGDGKVDFALGAGWTKIGTIHWLSRGDSLDQKWNVHKIGEEKWLHRMRFADVLGTGQPQLVISPLNKTVGNGVRLTALTIPKNPRTDRWQPTILNHSFNRMHNHWHTDLDGDGQTDTITASEEGLHLIRKTDDGFDSRQLSSNAAGEVKIGRLKGGRTFAAAVEPMHGTDLAVYLKPQGDASSWERVGLTDELVRGHAVWLADLDGDGSDEIVIGHSNTKPGENLPRGVFVYDSPDHSGKKWVRHVIDDGGVAVEDAVAADLTGDGRPDIVAGGRYTHNIKLYVNEGMKSVKGAKR